MTYIAQLDPEYRAAHEAVRTASEQAWDDFCPQWRELSFEPEHQMLVPANDVLDANDYAVAKRGNRYILTPPADDYDMPFTEIKF